MDDRNLQKKEKGPVIPAEERPCNREQALRTIRLLEKGGRQAFLDGEISVEDTKVMLGRVEEARESCEAGDINACLVLNELVAKLTESKSESA